MEFVKGKTPVNDVYFTALFLSLSQFREEMKEPDDQDTDAGGSDRSKSGGRQSQGSSQSVTTRK